MPGRLTLTKYLIQERRRFPSATGEFNTLLFDVATSVKLIAAAVARGALVSPRQAQAPASLPAS